MKRTMMSLVALVALGVGYQMIFPITSHGVEMTGQKVENTKREIAQTLVEGKRLGETIVESTKKLDSEQERKALIQLMAALDKNKRELEDECLILDKDLTALHNARAENWTAYQEHLKAVSSDSWTKHKWTKRGEDWYAAAGKVIDNGRELVSEAQGVIKQGGILEHLATMLRIERKMRDATGDVSTGITHLRASAGEYSRRADELLARVTESTQAD